jgi:phosphatidyl-myo-inositol dimannoside synthase
LVGGTSDGSADAIQDPGVGATVDPQDREALLAAVVFGLQQERVDPALIEPYRRPHFARVARALLAELTKTVDAADSMKGCVG